MIPLQLTLGGIYSYRQPQTIDFAPLTEAGIFGIFGAVGSGKSSILEAISFALYGEIERLNSREARAYNMMNLKSDALVIDFTFQSGEDTYRFVARSKRNRKQFGLVNAPDRNAYQRVDQEWVPIEPDAEAIIGLSYPNFRRTIIIPQGKFQEFLQLGEADRTRMMKDLFGLEKYELAPQVGRLEEKNRQELARLSDRLAQLSDADPALLPQWRAQLLTLRTQLEAANAQLATLREVENAFVALRDLFDRLNHQRHQTQQLLDRLPTFEALEARLATYEHCRLHFQPLLTRRDQLTTELGTLRSSLAAQVEEMNRLTGQLAAEDAALAALLPLYARRQELGQRADELDKLAQLLELQRQGEAAAARASQGEMQFSETLANARHLRQVADQRAAAVATLQHAQPDATQLAALQGWFATQANLTATRQTLVVERTRAQTRRAELATRVATVGALVQQAFASPIVNLPIVNPPNVDLSPEDDPTAGGDLPADLPPDAGAWLAEVARLGHALAPEADAVAAERQQLAVQQQLEAFADALRPGQPCPLCGATHHPHPRLAAHGQRARADVQARQHHLDARRRALSEATAALQPLAAQQAATNETWTQLAERQRTVDQQVTAHRALFVWPGFVPDRPDQLANALVEAADLKKQLERAAVTAATDRRAALVEEGNADRYRLATEQLRREGGELLAKSHLLQAQLTTLDWTAHLGTPPANLRHQATEQRQDAARVAREYERRDQDRQAAREAASRAAGKREADQAALARAQLAADEVAAQLADQLACAACGTLPEVEAALATPLDLTAERARLHDFQKNLHASQTHYQLLLEQARDKHYQPDDHIRLTGQIADLRATRDQTQQVVHNRQTDLQRLEANLANQRELLARQETARQRGEDIATLRKLFMASGFVNYVSSVYLQNLCRAANERFQPLTRQTLKLEITDKNEFQVRDFLHDGQTRSVKTLSGGQTFQAALCLALALADNLHQRSASAQNFFFLDEGFGSLDKESLQIVFETLKALRKEQRVVGIISHVEDLQQELDTHLRISNDDDHGSRVWASWKKN